MSLSHGLRIRAGVLALAAFCCASASFAQQPLVPRAGDRQRATDHPHTRSRFVRRDMGHDTREIPASVRVPRADTRWICRSTPIDGPLATVQAELAEYIRAQRLDRPIVVGHSLERRAGARLAARHPGLAGALVIVDTLPFTAGSRFQVKTTAEAEPAITAAHSTC